MVIVGGIAMKSDYRRGYNASAYVYGNAAQELKPQRRERVYENGQRVHQSQKELRSRDKALQMNGAYVFFLALVSVACLTLCVVYLSIQFEISETRNNITALKNDIYTITAKNEAVDYAIEGYNTAEYVIDIATNQLGMVEADADQVALYQSSDSEYTVQFKDIPN